MKRLLKWLVVAAVLVGAAWFGLALWRGHAYTQAFAAVTRGDSEARILQLFGHPHRVTGGPENVAWGSEDSIHRNRGDCVRVFWYSPPINIDGGAWTIGFDGSSNVVSKYNYRSP
jgi:hypothetical protein